MSFKEEHKTEATIGTIVVCAAVVFLLLMSFGFSKEPQLEDAGSVEVQFGDPFVGGPDNRPVSSQEQEQTPPQEEEQAEDLISQDVSDAEVKTSQNQTEKKKVENPKKEPEKKADEDLDNLLDKYKDRKTSKGQGTGEKTGTQGSKDGDKGATSGSDGTGDKGPGGTGNSLIKGYYLSGRKVVTPPELHETYNSKGIVVVDIVVDHTGRVVSAKAGARGSKYTDTKLGEIAEQLALRTKFEANPGAPNAEGTITFELKLN